MTQSVPAATRTPHLLGGTSRAFLLSSLHSRIRACAPKHVSAAPAAAAAPAAYAPLAQQSQQRAVVSLTLLLPAQPQHAEPHPASISQQPKDLLAAVERCYSLRQLSDVLGSHSSLLTLSDAEVSIVIVRARQLMQWSGHLASNKLLKSLSRKLAAALVQPPEPSTSLRPRVLLQALPLLADLGYVASQQWVVAACVGLLHTAYSALDKELAPCFQALQRMTGGTWLQALQRALEMHANGTSAGNEACAATAAGSGAAVSSKQGIHAAAWAPADAAAEALLVSPPAAAAMLCSLAGVQAQPGDAVLHHLTAALLVQQQQQQQQRQQEVQAQQQQDTQQRACCSPGRFTQALEALARLGWQPTAAITHNALRQVDVLLIQPVLTANHQPQAQPSAHAPSPAVLCGQLQRALWALARLQAHLPAAMQEAVLQAYHGQVHLLAPKQQCSLMYALTQLGCRPNPGWMHDWEAATISTLSSLGMHLHVSLMRSLAAIGYLPSSSWLSSWEAATQGMLSGLSTAQLADVAQSIASICFKPSSAWREAFWAACTASTRTAARSAGASAPNVYLSSSSSSSTSSSSTSSSSNGYSRGSAPAAAAALLDSANLVCAVAAAPGLQRPAGAPPAWASAVAAVLNSYHGSCAPEPPGTRLLPRALLSRLVWSAARLRLVLDQHTLQQWAMQLAQQLPHTEVVLPGQQPSIEASPLWRQQQQSQQPQPPPQQHRQQRQLQRQSACEQGDVVKQAALAVWGLASLGTQPAQQWLAPMDAHTTSLLPACDAQALVDLAWAFSKLRHCPSRAWRHAFYGQSLLLMEKGSFTPATLASMARALGTLQLKPPPRWRAVYYKCTAPLLLPKRGAADEHQQWDGTQLAAVCWALARSRVVPPAAWLLAWHAAVARQLHNMGAMPLSNVLWAAARWRRALTWTLKQHGIRTVEGDASEDAGHAGGEGGARGRRSGSGSGTRTVAVPSCTAAEQQHEEEWLERLLMQIQWHLQSCGPAHLAALISAASNLPLQPPTSWLDAAFDAVMAQLHAFNAPQLVCVLEALQRLEHVLSERRTEAILTQLQSLMSAGTVAPHSLARALTAVAGMSWADPGDAWLRAALAAAGAQLPGNCRAAGWKLGHAVQQLSALAELGVRQPQCGPWAGSFLAATRPLLARAAGGDLCKLAWGAAQLGWAPSRAYAHALLLALWRRIGTLSPSELALVGMGIAGLGLLPRPAWRARYLARAQQLSKQFSSAQDWASVAWALQHMQHRRQRRHVLLPMQPRRLLTHKAVGLSTAGYGTSRAVTKRVQHAGVGRARIKVRAGSNMEDSVQQGRQQQQNTD